MLLTHIIPISYYSATSILVGREYHSSILGYSIQTPGALVSVTGVYGGIPVIITIFSSIKIWKLKLANQVAPLSSIGNNSNGSNPLPLQQARKAFRMILLVSGTMWGTYIPTGVIRVAVFGAGYTWEDIDSRQYLVPSMFVRLATFLVAFTTSALNPIIYCYSRKDLRDDLFKTMGWKAIW
jgi:hypothetical protein